MTLRPLYPIAATLVRFWVVLRLFCQEQFVVSSICETPTHEINLSSANWLHSSLFLLVLFNLQVKDLAFLARSTAQWRLITRGDVVLRLRGFRSCCTEARSICVLFLPNQELPEPFERLNHPGSHQVVIKASGIPSDSHLHTLSFECFCVRPISPVPYRFSVLQPFRAIAFAYFSFRVRSIEFVSTSRSCCWLGRVRFQFVCFLSSFPPNRELLKLFERFDHPPITFPSIFFLIMKRGL